MTHSDPVDPVRGGHWPALAIVSLVILIAAAALRVWGAQNEFWLDEIWSLGLAQQVQSPEEVFTLHHDNNHYLVTLWMYLLGDVSGWIVYRIPSLLTGIGTVALAGWIARQWGSFAVVATLLLTASSYILVVYSSEARGYALAGFFALAAYLALQKFLANRDVRWALAFAGLSMLGFLSHLTFLQFYLGAMAWSFMETMQTPRSGAKKLEDLVLCHAAPLALVGVLYLVDVRYLRIGGGDRMNIYEMVAKSIALAVGAGSASLTRNLIVGGLTVAASLAAIVSLVRTKSDVWLFFLITVLIAPVALLVARRPDILYPRYFYINILFLLLLLGYFLGRLWQFDRLGRVLAVAWLAIIVAANLRQDVALLELGRGNAREALQYMGQHTAGRDVRVRGNHDTRVGLTLYYHRNALPQDKLLNFVLATDKKAPEPEWIVVFNQLETYEPLPALFNSQKERWDFERLYRSSNLSGFNIAIYHRASTTPPSGGS